MAGRGGGSHALIRILLWRGDKRRGVRTGAGVDAADGHADSVMLRVGQRVERGKLGAAVLYTNGGAVYAGFVLIGGGARGVGVRGEHL